jgi:thiol:disulfide interchange protein DsbD
MFRLKALRFKGILPAIVLAFVAALLAPDAGNAQGFAFPGGALVTADMSHSLSVFHPGSVGYVAITVDIAAGWHINADKPLESYLIPTVLEVSAPAGIEIVRLLYPKPVLRKLEISETKMALYDGAAVFGAVVRVGPDVRPGSYRITATIRYQGCNNRTCVEPASASADDTIRVGTLDEGVEQLDTQIFSKPPFAGDDGAPVGIEVAPSGPGDVGKMIEERGLAFAFLSIFLVGLALSLTPCIYPIIPITISYFGGQAGGRKSRAFLLAFLYVFGMSITYSVLGTVAAMTGSLFGSALQSPFVMLLLAAVLIALALSMFGFWEIRMPMFLARRTGSARQGYAGAVVMGLTMGIVAAPCIGPAVLGLLTYVGEMGKPLLGFLLFFTLAWGIGLPFLVLGTLSGSLSRLPRSGAWMIWVRKIFGFILLGMALYFVRHLAGPKLISIGYAAIAIAGGIYLGWIDRAAGASRGFKVLKRVVGIAGIALGAAFLVLPALRGGADVKPRGIAWQPFSEEAVLSAAREGKMVVIDFSAAWCALCHELDKKTFVDPEVVKLSAGFVPLRVDLTKSGPVETKIRNDYRIRGLPVIIFIDKAGNERAELRAIGFIDAPEFMRRVEALGGAPAPGAPAASTRAAGAKTGR